MGRGARPFGQGCSSIWAGVTFEEHMAEELYIPDCIEQRGSGNTGRLFVKGPIPLGWVKSACQAGAAELAWYLRYKEGLTRSKIIHIRPGEMKVFGLSEKVRRRQVKALEVAGLVKIISRPGQSHRLVILDSPSGGGL